jgi:hypothetical protein
MKRRPSATCLYSAASIAPRILSAASNRVFSMFETSLSHHQVREPKP